MDLTWNTKKENFPQETWHRFIHETRLHFLGMPSIWNVSKIMLRIFYVDQLDFHTQMCDCIIFQNIGIGNVTVDLMNVYIDYWMFRL